MLVRADAARSFLAGKARLKARQYDAAIVMFQDAIARQGLYPDACRGVAMCHYAQGDVPQTVAFLIKAAAHYIRLDRLDPAVRLFDSIRTIYPAAPNLFLLAAQAASRARRWERAVALFEQAGRVAPEDPECDLGHAEALLHLGREHEASSLVEALLFQGRCMERAEALYQRITGEPWSALGDQDMLDAVDEVVLEPDDFALTAEELAAEQETPPDLAFALVVVDDEPHIRMLMEEALEVLEEDEVRIYFARDGQEGLETIRRERPSLVFLDVMMPRMNGYQVCERIRAERDLRGMHIVMLSAKGQEVDKIKGEAVGADLYMTKPFSPMEVLAIARRFLGLPASV
ncbi:hypothetical protein JCM14635_21330 [Megalodesulfovibrio paquesii]